jgi:hypothetical protein
VSRFDVDVERRVGERVVGGHAERGIGRRLGPEHGLDGACGTGLPGSVGAVDQVHARRERTELEGVTDAGRPTYLKAMKP